MFNFLKRFLKIYSDHPKIKAKEETISHNNNGKGTSLQIYP
jgi:hypothetical protein